MFNHTMSIFHNHPSGSTFSPRDLHTFASDVRKSVYAIGNRYTYKIEKGTHFDSIEFIKALHKAKASSNNYNESANNWLREN